MEKTRIHLLFNLNMNKGILIFLGKSLMYYKQKKILQQNCYYPIKAIKLKTILRSSLLIAIILSGIKCLNGNEVLATFNGGNVKRNELKTIFKLRFGDEAVKRASIQMQDNTLRTFSLVKITAIEAKKRGLDKTDEYKKRISFLNLQTKLFALDRYLQENISDNKYEMMEIQYLFLRNQPGNLKKKIIKPDEKKKDTAPSPKELQAIDLLKKINDPSLSESDIEEIVSHKTEKAFYKVIAGYEVPICVSCSSNRSNFLTDRLTKVPMKKFIHIPNLHGGQWIIRKVNVKSINGDDLTSYYEAFYLKWARLAAKYLAKMPASKMKKQIAGRIPMKEKAIENRAKQYSTFLLRNEKRSLFGKKLKKLKEKKKFILHDAAKIQLKGKKQEYKNDTPLFTISGKAFTYGELVKHFPSSLFQQKEQLRFINLLIAYQIMKDEEEFNKAIDSDLYKFLINANYNNILYSLYIMKNLPKVEITDKQIKEWYLLRMNTQYKGKKFNSVKKLIKRQLERNSKTTAMQTLRGELTKKYKLNINRKALKANKL